MKPKLIALNLLLAACLLGLFWQIRVQWLAAQEVRRANLNVPVKPVAPPPITPAARPDAAVATRYADVASKNLFSKDRNANIIVDPPKIEIPKPMPPLPVVFGVMGLPSGTKIIMAEKAGAPSTTVRAGETLGEFKIAALDTQNITFEWNGKQLTRKVDDLIDRSGGQMASGGGQQQAQQQNAGPAAPPPPPQQMQAVNNNPTSKDLGDEMSAVMRGCKAGDTSPYGIVVDGYKKTSVPTPFGPLCRWMK
ncbi:MAG: hypothetical protein M3N54_08625 [Acidobacteriota bacterium]|nr:hypothetical protein [Acidobacteriota bacterium]